VVKSGRFRPVNVIGDAGLGKSRLIFEFTEALRDQSVLLLEAICRPEGSAVPFLPLIEVMRSWFDIPEEGARVSLSRRSCCKASIASESIPNPRCPTSPIS
jgi:predicted ATPase